MWVITTLCIDNFAPRTQAWPLEEGEAAACCRELRLKSVITADIGVRWGYWKIERKLLF